MTAAPIDGTFDPAFDAVPQAFAENFEQRGEVGAAVTVVVNGRTVVDMWGGWAGVPTAPNPRPWQRDSLVNAFSVGKAFAALCVARLDVDPDSKVATYWPEFAANHESKADITVAHLLSHQAGLPAVRRRLPSDAMLHHDVMATALAEQEPWWEPGTAHGYHTNTFGFLVGELVRRVDGRTVGEMLREEIAGPLDADVHLGLPAHDHQRVADFLWPEPPPPELQPEGLDDAHLMEFNAYYNPSGLSGAGVVNTAQWRQAEIPSTNTHATARGVARIYEALCDSGEVDGVRIVERATLERFTREQVSGDDLILHRPSRFGLGFQLTQPERPLGPGRNAFGHFGAGGSLGFCDPDARLAFGYVINSMGPRWQNPRNRALIDAVYESLG